MYELMPINGKIIIKELEDDSGILIPKSSGKEKIFEVVMSDNKKIKPKAKIVVDEYAGKEKHLQGKVLFFIDYDDIIAIITQ